MSLDSAKMYTIKDNHIEYKGKELNIEAICGILNYFSYHGAEFTVNCIDEYIKNL